MVYSELYLHYEPSSSSSLWDLFLPQQNCAINMQICCRNCERARKKSGKQIKIDQGLQWNVTHKNALYSEHEKHPVFPCTLQSLGNNSVGRANHLNLKQVQISSGNSLVFRVFRKTETFCLFASIFAVLSMKNFFLMAPTKLVSSSQSTMNFAIMNFYLWRTTLLGSSLSLYLCVTNENFVITLCVKMPR